jgi:aminoglycoside phosphotransferase (APT) family kinase protein
VFVKHSRKGWPRDSLFRGGVEYEAKVYELVVDGCGLSRPRYYGVIPYRDGRASLVLEYIDGALSVSKAADRDAMARAASWIGRFHMAPRLSERAARTLVRYDDSYFEAWGRRAKRNIEGHALETPWLTELCDSFGAASRTLFSSETTVVHGEFYPDNILYRNRTLYPIDWEWAALAPGLIDLAALTDGPWGHNTIMSCLEAYCSARWGGRQREARDLEQELAAARIYLFLRWLGGKRDRAMETEARRRAGDIEPVAERLGLI